ncbi:hypothetical protein CL622_07380 [archaeon]|nr:hypothetical protein [archaeon]|tara:strand:+ start:514 stop:840 length:327 start_codon:yes stop_codon:yes gene_type:complete
MEYSAGQELRFRKDIELNLWVDSIFPAGQLGYKETHIRVKIDGFILDIPVSAASKILEDNAVVEKKKDEDKIKVSPKAKSPAKRKSRTKIVKEELNLFEEKNNEDARQ